MFILKRKVLYSLVLLLFATTISIFFQKQNNIQIDNPFVKYDSIEISTIKTDFTYSNIFNRKKSFHSDTNNIIKTIKPVNVMANKKLSFLFKQKPKSYTVVKLLDNGNYQTVLDVKEEDNDINYIIIPNEYGKQIYSISANYNEGVGIYYFSVYVNDPSKNTP